jgi:hypothetical protein
MVVLGLVASGSYLLRRGDSDFRDQLIKKERLREAVYPPTMRLLAS